MKFQNSKKGSNIFDVKKVPFPASLVTVNHLFLLIQYLMMIPQGNNVDDLVYNVLTVHFYDKNL